MILGIITGFAFFVTAIVFHELGHFIVAHRQNLQPKIIFTGTRLYTECIHQPLVELRKHFFSVGIFLGLVPLFIGLYVTIYTFAFIPLYVMGIVSDIKQLRYIDANTRKNN
jgi:hypothetical protein